MHTFGPNILGPKFIFLVFQNELGISTNFSLKKKIPNALYFEAHILISITFTSSQQNRNYKLNKSKIEQAKAIKKKMK